MVLIIVILSRRLTWCILQQIQSHWKPKPPAKGSSWQGGSSAKSRSSKGGGAGGSGSSLWGAGLWDLLLWNWTLNVKRCVVLLCIIPAVIWSVAHLVQNTPIFNLLFLFYP